MTRGGYDTLNPFTHGFARAAALAFVLFCGLCGRAGADPSAAPAGVTAADEAVARDLASARAVFEANLEAIQNRDAAAYLACYRDDPSLSRNGPGGVSTGYADWAPTVGEGWPSVFEAMDLTLVRLRPGLVYGSYRYRVRFGDEEQTGVSERLFMETPEGWRIAVTTAFPAPEGTPPPLRALVGATLVDGTGAPPIPDAVVVIRDGAIEAAGRRSDVAVPEDADVVDLSGRWIVPGFVDASVHLSASDMRAAAGGRAPAGGGIAADGPGATAADGLPVRSPGFLAAARSRLDACLAAGVTTALDTGGYPWVLDLAANVAPRIDVARLRVAGPGIVLKDPGPELAGERGSLEVGDAREAAAAVEYLGRRGADAIVLDYTSARGARSRGAEGRLNAVAAAARIAGLPLVVRVDGVREATAAVRAGASVLLGSVEDQPLDGDFLALARRRGVAWVPLLATTARRPKDAARTAVENARRLRAAGIPIAVGSDGGDALRSPGGSVFAEMDAMAAAGFSPMEILVAATAGGARVFNGAVDGPGAVDPSSGTTATPVGVIGGGPGFGAIEAGKAADLLVLSADPLAGATNLRRIERVMRGGELRGVEELARR